MSRLVRMVHQHNLNADYNTSLGWAIDNPRKAARKKKHDDAYEPMTNELVVKHFAKKRRWFFWRMDAILARHILDLAKRNKFLEEVTQAVFYHMPGLPDEGQKVLRLTEKGHVLLDRPFGFLTVFMQKYGHAVTFLTGGVVVAFLVGLYKAFLALYSALL